MNERAPKENGRIGSNAEALKQSVKDHLTYTLGKVPAAASRHDYYKALALAVRDRMQHLWGHSVEAYTGRGLKIACYLSAEFLMGPHLGNNIVNLGIEHEVRQALNELGFELDELLSEEEEPGLGNGGLGRLAACYLDSLATLMYPAIGYGIRYEFGIFNQEIRDGWQVEVTDKWLRYGNPWEIAKPSVTYNVGIGGHTEHYTDENGRYRVRWIPDRMVKGMAYDTPILGYRVNTCNTLRLWSAEACESFDFQAFNAGDYYEAVQEKMFSETITKVLYPNDEPIAGKKLRLIQQYFFVSCSLQDMLHLLRMAGESIVSFPERFAVQLNDTHPSIAVAELMRLLLDEHGMDWETAWDITTKTFGYTNHTLMPEALESWPLPLFQDQFPRHLEIIFEINRRFLDEVRKKFKGDDERVKRMSIIQEGEPKRVRMAHLACIGSHAINGVAVLHTELLKTNVLRDFYDMWPKRFLSITNGVTPRRFLRVCNTELSDLINETIGIGWVTDLYRLRELEPFAKDAEFRKKWRGVKRAKKERLAQHVFAQTGIQIDPDWFFDIQVKRIHEYKRQHLNVLYIISQYLRIKDDPKYTPLPRVFLFGGKAAPGYFMAKRIIKLINAAAEVINSDPKVNRLMRVAFIPDFNVQRAQLIYPAGDLSVQISTAGKEASGTGNMKFMMNGAATIGTLDGANIEILREVGQENFFLFGLTAEEIEIKKHLGYRPASIIENDQRIAEALSLLSNGHFSGGDKDVFFPIVENLRWDDPFFVLADFASYADCQEEVQKARQDTERWTRISILNTARSGKFSSDRAIREYAKEIWDVKPATVSTRERPASRKRKGAG
jgi:starch phosphorylase